MTFGPRRGTMTEQPIMRSDRHRYDLVRSYRPGEAAAKRQRPTPERTRHRDESEGKSYSRWRRFVFCASAAGTKDRAMSRAQRMNDCTIGVRVRFRSVTIATGGRTH